MSGSLNKVMLIGHLGQDPEIRTLENGVSLARISIATTETFKNKSGERVSHTEWHSVILWRALAEVAEKYLKKGHQVYIEGRIKSRSWEDKETGQKRFAVEIIGDQMTMLTSKKESNANPVDRTEDNISAEDLPF